MPQISVIVPVYKVEPYLCRCVDSILGQSFEDFELILVDDGSPDRCGAICDEYAAKDSRVHVIHQENGGLSAARNAGIDWAFAHSDSQWLSFVDSDDWVHPQYLEYLFCAVTDTSCGISVCGFSAVRDTCAFLQIPLAYRQYNNREFMTDCPNMAIPACGKLYKKSFFTQIRYPRGRLHEDEFVTYQLLVLTESISVIENELYYYFMNPSGITKSEWTPKRLDALIACEERIAFFQRREDAEMVKNATNMMLSYVYLSQEKIKKSKKKRTVKKNTAILLRYVRRFLARHPEITVSKVPGLYEFAYPGAMRIYWWYHAARKRLHLLKKEGNHHE